MTSAVVSGFLGSQSGTNSQAAAKAVVANAVCGHTLNVARVDIAFSEHPSCG